MHILYKTTHIKSNSYTFNPYHNEILAAHNVITNKEEMYCDIGEASKSLLSSSKASQR